MEVYTDGKISYQYIISFSGEKKIIIQDNNRNIMLYNKHIKNMKNVILFLLLLTFSIEGGLAQKIAYTYDAAGNRVSRQYVVGLRSATVSKIEGIDSTLVEAFLDNWSVFVYPNPTKGALSVKVANVPKDKKVMIKLYSPNGLQLQNINVSDGINPVNMLSYVSGWYILRVHVGEKNIEFKIIKE